MMKNINELFISNIHFILCIYYIISNKLTTREFSTISDNISNITFDRVF